MGSPPVVSSAVIQVGVENLAVEIWLDCLPSCRISFTTGCGKVIEGGSGSGSGSGSGVPRIVGRRSQSPRLHVADCASRALMGGKSNVFVDHFQILLVLENAGACRQVVIGQCRQCHSPKMRGGISNRGREMQSMDNQRYVGKNGKNVGGCRERGTLFSSIGRAGHHCNTTTFAPTVTRR